MTVYSNFVGNGHGSYVLKCVQQTWHELTTIQKDCVTPHFSVCGEIQRGKMGEIRYGQV